MHGPHSLGMADIPTATNFHFIASGAEIEGVPSLQHHRALTAPSPYHHCAITVPSLINQSTILMPSQVPLKSVWVVLTSNTPGNLSRTYTIITS